MTCYYRRVNIFQPVPAGNRTQDAGSTGKLPTTGFYSDVAVCLPVDPSIVFYSDVVECLPVDPATDLYSDVIYKQPLYHVAVKAGFYSDVVECLSVDQATGFLKRRGRVFACRYSDLGSIPGLDR